jgi:hypothetical protein
MVTYLLGAGASANALPLVGEDFKKRLEVFVKELKRIEDENETIVNKSSIYEHLLKQVKAHASPDTYAKKLFLLGENWLVNYNQFKNFLGCYIIWEQLEKGFLTFKKNDSTFEGVDQNTYNKISKLIDDRYDVFCAALQNSPAELPINFSLISWNYDWQLEKTINQYDITGWTLEETRNKLNIENKSFRLNGSAWFENKNSFDNKYPFNNLLIKDDEYLRLFCDIINDDKNAYKNHLKFAWEFDINTVMKNQIDKILSNSNTIVVIGYSFPYYNRKVDKLIIESFLKNKDIDLEKSTFYLQYPNKEECDRIKRKLISIINTIEGFNNFIGNDKIFVPIYSEDQFYIPDELL